MMLNLNSYVQWVVRIPLPAPHAGVAQWQRRVNVKMKLSPEAETLRRRSSSSRAFNWIWEIPVRSRSAPPNHGAVVEWQDAHPIKTERAPLC